MSQVVDSQNTPRSKVQAIRAIPGCQVDRDETCKPVIRNKHTLLPVHSFLPEGQLQWCFQRCEAEELEPPLVVAVRTVRVAVQTAKSPIGWVVNKD